MSALAAAPAATEFLVNDFATASREVLAFLHRRFDFGLWMVTRTEGDDWIVLHAEDHGYGVTPGTVFSWADSFCSQMVQGRGPRMAPDSELIPAYAAAPIGRSVAIGAYIGMPLVRQDGGLFGTLCAIDPVRQPAAIVEEQGMIELLAVLLSTVLQSDLRTAESIRQRERLEVEAQTDALTGLFNRRAWDQLLAREEERCRRYGHPAAILIMDLDELKRANDSLGHAAGDALITRAGDALRAAARDVDVIARLGGDEFAVLAVECGATGADALLQRAREALHSAGIKASAGVAVRAETGGLQAAWEAADQRMFQEKRRGVTSARPLHSAA